MTMKRVLVPPLVPALILVGLLTLTSPDSYSVSDMAGQALFLGPGIYLFCVFLNLIEAAVARLLGRYHWWSLMLTPVCLGVVGLIAGQFAGSTIEKLLLAFGGTTVLIAPIGVLRRWMLRNAEPSAAGNSRHV